jgi:hypothetical protein
MSYDLDLIFERPIKPERFLEYFERRRRFAVSGTTIAYENPDTGVEFAIDYSVGGLPLLGRGVKSASFELNYVRPSYFGLEAERELTALVSEFQPRIEDAQMQGMGRGPYSPEGFLRGWNFGNEFAVRHALESGPAADFASMPAEKLLAFWNWNYRLQTWKSKAGSRQFVPRITPDLVEGAPSLTVVWPMGMPILLPAVDYVYVGREVDGEKRFGLSPWSEVLGVAARAGADTAKLPLSLDYSRTPEAIAQWIAEIPLVDIEAAPGLSPDQLIDSEILDAAGKQVG